MKQQITVGQLNELSPESHNNLSIWCVGHGNGEKWQIAPRLLNIGEMIEFLEYSHPEWRGLSMSHYPGGDMSFPEWLIIGMYDDGRAMKRERKPELCDALWELVKEELEKV